MNFKEKFLATRLAIESVLFEKEVSSEKKPDKRYYRIIFYLFVLHFFINLYYFYFNNDLTQYFLYNLNYSQISFKEILFHTDILSDNFEMPLYHILFKLISFVIDITPWTVFCFNIIISFLGLTGYYLLITKTKNEQTAVIAIAVLLSTPFFIEISRHNSSQLLTFTSLVWTYYYFVKMKIDEQYKSVPYFVFFYSIGLLSDKFFLVYTLPCFSLLSFLLSTVYASYIITIFIPAALISVIFYIRFLIIFIIKYSFGTITFSYFNLKEIFEIYADSFGLIHLLIIVPFFIWMVFSVYNVYVSKKEILGWIVYPLFLFFLILPQSDLVRFTIPAVIVGFSVMLFGNIRNYFLYFFVVIIFISGLNIFPVKIREYHLWGYTDKMLGDDKIIRHILYALSLERYNKSFGMPVSLKFYEKNFRANAFNIFKRRYLLDNIRFYDFPEELLPFSCYVITDKKSVYLKDFEDILIYKGIYLLKNPFCEKTIVSNINNPINIKVNDLDILDMKININRSSDSVDGVYLDIGYLGYKGIDLYGVKLKLKDIYINTNYKYLLSGFSYVDVISAIINQYSVDAFLTKIARGSCEITFLNELVKFRKTLKLLDFDIVVYFYPTVEDKVIYFNIVSIKMGSIKISPFFSKFFVFKLPYKRLFPLSFKKIQISNDLIKIS